jgi:hypothetical protein
MSTTNSFSTGISLKSNLYGAKLQIKREISDSSDAFKERFKGKTTLMNKDGHLGVVISTSIPIDKDSILKLNY